MSVERCRHDLESPNGAIGSYMRIVGNLVGHCLGAGRHDGKQKGACVHAWYAREDSCSYMKMNLRRIQ